jgi:hypothetical protein
VNSSRDGGRYHTGACSRTATVESEDAVEDLKALRALESNSPLSARIYGRILPSDLRPDILVRLTRDQDEKSLHPDASGSFSFGGLEKTQYRLQIQDGRGTGERIIDLSRVGCFEATLWFSDFWRVAGSPARVESDTRPTP